MFLLDEIKLPGVQRPVDLDQPAAFRLHRKILLSKPFLKRLYKDFYEVLGKTIAENPHGNFLEIGSGAGIIKTIFPLVITSDVIAVEDIDICCSALSISFKNDALDAIFMLDTLHHLPNATQFFNEAGRCLKTGGRVVMVEPANTWFARLIYQNFHHEVFDPNVEEWAFDSQGPLSSANGALPWIIFKRDRGRFEKNFPNLRIISYRNHTPFRYLLSGGFTLKQLVPSWSYQSIKALEKLLTPFNDQIGLFTTIILEKN
ncbi:MAG: methyltransferase domain-containing protein [Candidatus Omnitrophota bacterium]